MRKFLTICAILLSIGASAQWQQTGSKVRYVNGIGIPTKDTAAGVSADSSQILIRPADSSLYVKYKRTWQKVGSGGGGTVTGSGTTNYVSKFTSSTAIGNSQIFDNGTQIGFGTATPGANYHFRSSDAELRLESTTSVDGFIRFVNTSGSMSIGMAGSASNTLLTYDRINNHIASEYLGGGSGYHAWHTNNTEKARIIASGNFGIGYTAPAAKLSVNGTTLINTNTDNGVDALQVSGSAIATVLKATGTGNNLAILNGTGTTNAYIDFQNAGTTQWRAGNDYNGGNRLFRINDVAGSVNTMLVNSSNQIGFNMPTTSFLGANSAMEFHKAGTQYIHRHFTYSSSGLGVQWIGYSTRSNTPGSFSATQINDPIIGFSAYGSSNSAHVFGADFFYTQKGATSTYIPGAWEFQASSGSVANQTRFYVHGADDNIQFWTTSTERMRVATSGRVLLNTTTDNGVDELQVNGSISGIGFKQAYVTKTGAYTATNDDYVIDCTSGTFTVTLPASSGRTGRILIIKNSGAGTITVDGNASETIDGATTYSLSVQYATVQIMSDGTNWKIISKF
jgi:hypothetical protein